MEKLEIYGIGIKQLVTHVNKNVNITDFIYALADGTMRMEYGCLAQHILNGVNGERIIQTICIPFNLESEYPKGV